MVTNRHFLPSFATYVGNSLRVTSKLPSEKELQNHALLLQNIADLVLRNRHYYLAAAWAESPAAAANLLVTMSADAC